MKLLSKLKNLFSKNHQTTTDEPAPISRQIMHYLDARKWQYEYRPADNEQALHELHHISLNLTDRQREWTCIFRINEKNQLVGLFAILPDIVPHSHFAPMIMAIANANRGVDFGSIEFSPADGIIHAKLSFDVEFAPLTDRLLDCYLHAATTLSELAQNLYDEVMNESEPSPILLDYLHYNDLTTADDGKQDSFFVPTEQYQ